jgi:phosphotransacetylase
MMNAMRGDVSRLPVLVLPEGEDARIIAAARQIADQGIARPVVIGAEAAVAKAEYEANYSWYKPWTW